MIRVMMDRGFIADPQTINAPFIRAMRSGSRRLHQSALVFWYLRQALPVPQRGDADRHMGHDVPSHGFFVRAHDLLRCDIRR